MSDFYKKLLEDGFYKEASVGADNSGLSTDAIKELIDSSFTTEQMEVMAEELNLMFEKEATEVPVDLEQNLEKEAKEDSKEDEPEEDSKEDEPEEDSKEDEPEEDSKEEAEDESDKVANLVVEMREKLASMNEEMAKLTAAIEDLAPEKEAETEDSEELSKEAQEEAMMIKEAYDLAAQQLVDGGYTLHDYVMSKVANEKLADMIVEAAEKLAGMQDSNPLLEADVMMSKIAEQLDEQN